MKKITDKKGATEYLGERGNQISNSGLNKLKNRDYNTISFIDKENKNYTVSLINMNGEQIKLSKDIKIKQAISYDNGDWSYQDEKGYWHLFRLKNNQWIELTKNVEALYIWSYKDGDWKYQDKKGFEHLFRFINGDWNELTKGIETVYVCPLSNGNWEYKNSKGYKVIKKN